MKCKLCILFIILFLTSCVKHDIIIESKKKYTYRGTSYTSCTGICRNKRCTKRSTGGYSKYTFRHSNGKTLRVRKIDYNRYSVGDTFTYYIWYDGDE